MANDLLKGINSMVEESKAEPKKETKLVDPKFDDKWYDQMKQKGWANAKERKQGSIPQDKLAQMNTATDIEKEVFKNPIGKKNSQPTKQYKKLNTIDDYMSVDINDDIDTNTALERMKAGEPFESFGLKEGYARSLDSEPRNMVIDMISKEHNIPYDQVADLYYGNKEGYEKLKNKWYEQEQKNEADEKRLIDLKERKVNSSFGGQKLTPEEEKELGDRLATKKAYDTRYDAWNRKRDIDNLFDYSGYDRSILEQEYDKLRSAGYDTYDAYERLKNNLDEGSIKNKAQTPSNSNDYTSVANKIVELNQRAFDNPQGMDEWDRFVDLMNKAGYGYLKPEEWYGMDVDENGNPIVYVGEDEQGFEKSVSLVDLLKQNAQNKREDAIAEAQEKVTGALDKEIPTQEGYDDIMNNLAGNVEAELQDNGIPYRDIIVREDGDIELVFDNQQDMYNAWDVIPSDIDKEIRGGKLFITDQNQDMKAYYRGINKTNQNQWNPEKNPIQKLAEMARKDKGVQTTTNSNNRDEEIKKAVINYANRFGIDPSHVSYADMDDMKLPMGTDIADIRRLFPKVVQQPKIAGKTQIASHQEPIDVEVTQEQLNKLKQPSFYEQFKKQEQPQNDVDKLWYEFMKSQGTDKDINNLYTTLTKKYGPQKAFTYLAAMVRAKIDDLDEENKKKWML